MSLRNRFEHYKQREKAGIRPEFSIFPILPIGGASCIAGAGGIGKTTLATNLAAFLLSGSENEVMKAESPGSALTILPERVPNYFAAMDGYEKQHKTPQALISRRSIPVSSTDLDDWARPLHNDFVNRMTEFVGRINDEGDDIDKVRLITFDSAFFLTDGDEASGEVATRVMNNLRDLAQNTQSSVLVILHSLKDNSGYAGSPRWRDRAENFLILSKEKGTHKRLLGNNAKNEMKLGYSHCAPFSGLTYDYKVDAGIPYLFDFQIAKKQKANSKIDDFMNLIADRNEITFDELKEIGSQAGFNVDAKQWYRPLVATLTKEGFSLIGKDVRSGLSKG